MKKYMVLGGCDNLQTALFQPQTRILDHRTPVTALLAHVKKVLDECSDGWAFNLRYAKGFEVSQRLEFVCAAQA